MNNPNLFDRIGLWLGGVPVSHVVEHPATQMGRVALGHALLLSPALGSIGTFATMLSLGCGRLQAGMAAAFAAVFLLWLDRAVFMARAKREAGLRFLSGCWPRPSLTLCSPHVLVLAAFSGEIGREQRAVVADEKRTEDKASEQRLTSLLAPFQTEQQQLTNEITAVTAQRPILVARGEDMEKELADVRQKLDDEYQGKRASGIAKPGPETRRLEGLIEALEKKRTKVADDIKSLDKQTADLRDDIAKVAKRADQDPQISAERDAHKKRIEGIENARRGDVLSRTRALHAVMLREKELFGLYLVILCALFLLDTAAILIKTTAPADAVDFQRDTETCNALTNMEAARQHGPAIAIARQFARAQVDGLRDELSSVKDASTAKLTAFVSLLDVLDAETGTVTRKIAGVSRRFDRQGHSELSERLKAQGVRVIGSILEDSMETFVKRTPAENGPSSGPIGSHNASPRMPSSRNGATAPPVSEPTTASDNALDAAA